MTHKGRTKKAVSVTEGFRKNCNLELTWNIFLLKPLDIIYYSNDLLTWSGI